MIQNTPIDRTTAATVAVMADVRTTRSLFDHRVRPAAGKAMAAAAAERTATADAAPSVVHACASSAG